MTFACVVRPTRKEPHVSDEGLEYAAAMCMGHDDILADGKINQIQYTEN